MLDHINANPRRPVLLTVQAGGDCEFDLMVRTRRSDQDDGEVLVRDRLKPLGGPLTRWYNVGKQYRVSTLTVEVDVLGASGEPYDVEVSVSQGPRSRLNVQSVHARVGDDADLTFAYRIAPPAPRAANPKRLPSEKLRPPQRPISGVDDSRLPENLDRPDYQTTFPGRLTFETGDILRKWPSVLTRPSAAFPPSRDDAEYEVWYGTNRNAIEKDGLLKGFGSKRDARVHFGKCRVLVPTSHKIGSTGSPWWKRLITRDDDRLRLTERQALDADRFWRDLRAALEVVPTTERHAVVFLHGYNVTFDNAALRAAQLGLDLSVRGAMGFFSWPSRGTLKGYLADEASIEASEDHIADFLVAFAQAAHGTPVSVIAHSMGNRGILRAVNRIIATAHSRTAVRFHQFILAAADVDGDVFRKLCAPYAALGDRTTLYVSEHDNAVGASHFAHGAPRIGRIPPVPVIDQVDTVNVGPVDLSLLGHGYVAETRPVLNDMHSLIWNDVGPEKRFGLKKLNDGDGKVFWKIAP